MRDLTLLLLAKQPLPGRVKTRLCPPLEPEQAARVAAAALRDTAAALQAVPARRRVLVLDGEPGAWCPPGFEVVAQVGGDLADRLAGAFALVDGPAALVGVDTPQLRPTDLALDFERHPAWLGPAPDGGFWAIGLREPAPWVFPGVAMSTEHTGRDQLARLRAAGLSVGRLPTLRDVDTIADARLVAAAAPRSRFAHVLQDIETGSSHPDVFDLGRWAVAPDAADESLLARCAGHTLDVGCGPGRIAAALRNRGGSALGIDVADAALDLARTAGARVLNRSVFAELPREGGWDTVVLGDGNVGIGGDPMALMRRVAVLLRPGGTCLLEPAPDDAPARAVRVASGGRHSSPFAWAGVGVSAALVAAQLSGLHLVDSWAVGSRRFLSLRRGGRRVAL